MPIRAENPEEFRKLEAQVRNYLKNNPYPGEGHLALEKLVLQPADGTTRLAKVELKEPSRKLDKLEKDWLRNLKSLGDSYGVRVVLDEKHYLR